MRLIRLKVENFRTLESLELDFPYYYSAICVKNDSGKTNIIRAIRGLMNEHDPFGYADEDEISLKSDFTKWKQVDPDKREITIAMSLSANRNSDAGLYEFLTNYLSLGDVADDLEFCVDVRLMASESAGRVKVLVGQHSFDGLKAQDVLKKVQSSRMILFHNSTEPDPRLRYGRPFREISEQRSDEIDKLNQTIKRGLDKIARGHQEQISELIGRLDQKYKLTVRSFLDQFQTLPYNPLIFETLKQPEGSYTVHGWAQGAKQAKSRPIVNLKNSMISYTYQILKTVGKMSEP